MDYSNYTMPQPEAPLDKKALKAQKKYDKIQRKTEKKLAGGGKGKKYAFRAVAAVVCAVLLGGIAGIACYGVSYAGYKIFPISTNVVSTNSTGSSTNINQVSSISDGSINATVYDVSDIVANVISSVVAINGTYTTTQNYGFFGSQSYESTVSGSGIIIGTSDNNELLVVTNAHVVEDVSNLAVTFYDGSEASAVIKGIRSDLDLAVLAINISDIPSDAVYSIAALGDSDSVKVGEAAIAVGNSMGYGISVTTGCISALDKSVTVDSTEYTGLIQTDAAINPGNSGGALFNSNGEVIGINSVKMGSSSTSSTSVEGMGYAISISSVKDVIQELSLQETKVQLSDNERGYLGITGISITSDISNTYGYPQGVAIRSVSADSAAEKAGLVKNDIITSFDGKTITTIDELVATMSYYAVGEKVEIKYYHMSDGEYVEKTTTVTLTAKTE